MLVIAETSTSTWHYHLREIAGPEDLKLGGGAGDAICGAQLGWDTTIPLAAWGSKSHVPQKWCAKCEKIAADKLGEQCADQHRRPQDRGN